MNDAVPPITELLRRWRDGDRAAEDALMTAVYPVLRDLARSRLRRHADDMTLSATELANEAYMRLLGVDNVDWQSRDHFFVIAAKVIRGLAVDYARARGAEKRGGGLPFVSLDRVDDETPAPIDLDVDWLAVNQVLVDLAVVDAPAAKIVELRVFAGLSIEEVARVCGLSTATVGRLWRFARVWLAERLTA
jgi:RNA polymerase sigma factor (TIGR02999 family)